MHTYPFQYLTAAGTTHISKREEFGCFHQHTQEEVLLHLGDSHNLVVGGGSNYENKCSL